MGYDPEVELSMQVMIDGLRAGTQKIADLVGEEHPATKFLEAVDNCINVINDMRSEAASCFDEDEKEQIQKEALSMLAILQESLQSLMALMDREETMSEAERIVREKAGDKADEIVNDVRSCADYFLMQGGADGTFGHSLFYDNYGHLMPEITTLAEEFGAGDMEDDNGHQIQ